MKNPLVSVIVLTYNSGLFVEETLESIKNQSYSNIELIISDDGSNDNTIRVCTKWLDENKYRFIHSNILISTKNTGIPANYNRGFKASKGDWIKYISGDDTLIEDCIEQNIRFIQDNRHIKVLYSYNRVYLNTFTEKNFLYLNPKAYPKNIINDALTAEDQYKILLKGDRISFTPTRVFSRSVLLDIGLPDEDLYSEDFQLKLRMTKAGYKLHFMEKETVKYRMHGNASNNTSLEYILKPHYFKTENFRKRYVYPFIRKVDKYDAQFCWYVNQLFKIGYLNKRNSFNTRLFYLLNILINPFAYIKKLSE